MAYHLLGKSDTAIQLSQRSLSLNNSHHEPYMNLGDAHSAKGNLEKAKLSYRQSISINQHLYPAYTQLAGVYVRQGKPHRAEQLLEEALLVN